MSCFPKILAIDFETADQGTDSACAIGAALIAGNRIVAQEYRLIRPPRPRVMFTYIHGISWHDVADQPHFGEIWQELAWMFAEADAFAAHNAGFDRGVLHGCSLAYGLTPPEKPWICTVKLARAAWNIRPTKLPNVCDHFGIELDHHDAMSDARACAEIALHAISDGFDLMRGVLGTRAR